MTSWDKNHTALHHTGAGLFTLCRVKIHVTGLEKVPTDTEYLFVSNYRSNFDPMVQWWVLRRWRLAFVSKP